jgi:superfamily II helicase
MKLSQFKNQLSQLGKIAFELPDGTLVPSHFHVTEVGKVIKHFIDCGGKERLETVVNFQLWEANDYDHRLHPEKLASIIDLSKEKLGLPDAEIEVEYQAGTIGKFGIDFNGKNFVLTNKLTNCLAPDSCGIPQEKLKIKLSDVPAQNSCAPGSGCC